MSGFFNRTDDTVSKRMLKFGIRQLALVGIVVIAVVIYFLVAHR